MVITERELRQLEKINGFEYLGKYNQTLLDIYEQLDGIYNLINSADNEPSLKNLINRSKMRARELERKIKKLRNEYYIKLERYERKYGQNETYKILKEVIENTFYVVFENKYAISDDYVVNYKQLKKKNNKIITKKIKMAKKEMI